MADMESNSNVRQYPHMATGDGEKSYARNSRSQGEFVRRLLGHVHAAIDRMELPRDGKVVVADLGCGSGPNAIANVQAIIKLIDKRYGAQRSIEDTEEIIPIFQVYFQDLPTNDFNTLFQYLAKAKLSDVDAQVGHQACPTYFAAGVPGSFYSSLFPPQSLHIAFSSWAVHWISKIPAAVLDRNSPAYNGGNIELCRSSDATLQAYAEQADQDFRDFLAARATEMVPGGLLILTFVVRLQGDLPCYISGTILKHEDDIMDQLVSEGVVAAEVRDSFNTWAYYRSLQEVKKSVESFKSVFELQTSQVLPYPVDTLADDDPKVQAQNITNQFRGFQDGFMVPHFGAESMELFWRKLKETLSDHYSKQTYSEELAREIGITFFVLLRVK